MLNFIVRGCVVLSIMVCGFFRTDVAAQNADADLEWSVLEKILDRYQGIAKTPPEGIVTPKFSTGALLGNGDLGVVAGESTHEQAFRFGKLDFWGGIVKNPATNDRTIQEGSITLGGLAISGNEPPQNADAVYKMTQDIKNAEVRTEMAFGATVVEMRSWIADSKNIFVTELRNRGDAPAKMTAKLWTNNQYQYQGEWLDAAERYPYGAGIENETLWLTRACRSNDGYMARVALATRLIGGKAEDASTSTSSAQFAFALAPRATVRLVTVVRSDRGFKESVPPAAGGSSNPVTTIHREDWQAAAAEVMSADALRVIAVREAEEMDDAAVDWLLKDHREWWKQYWLKSYVSLGDETLERFYYGSLYVIGCNFRENQLIPPGIWGVWTTTDFSTWGGRYFLNYNAEAPMYGICSSNRGEMAKAYYRRISMELPYQVNATARAGFPGAEYRRSLTPYNLFRDPPAPEPIAAERNLRRLPAADQHSNGSFAAMPLLWYWEYYREKAFLRQHLYPLLKELDAFWQADLNKTKKPYDIENSSAHEGSRDINPNLDLGFIRKICRTLLETSEILGVDEDLQPIWRDTLANLAPFPTTEYMGKTVFTEAQVKNGSTSPTRLFHVGCQPVNMEGGVFPGENIYVGGDPEMLKIGVDSVALLDGWSTGSRSGGGEHNGFCKIYPVAARVGYPAEELITNFKAAIDYHMQGRMSNLTCFQGGGGIETAGAIEGINSMLLQSEGGVLRVFPVWPSGRDASFTRLRAKGAFVISSRFANGRVIDVDVLSEKGGDLRLITPWANERAQAIQVLSDGSERNLNPVVSAGEIIIPTSPGERYRITAGR